MIRVRFRRYQSIFEKTLYHLLGFYQVPGLQTYTINQVYFFFILCGDSIFILADRTINILSRVTLETIVQKKIFREM